MTPLSNDEQKVVLDCVRKCIEFGLSHIGLAPILDVSSFSVDLQKQAASFVTITKRNSLRGSIGTYEAYRPLIADISDNAFKASFQDSRFPQIMRPELEHLEFHISILGPVERIFFSHEEEIKNIIQANQCGVLIKEGLRQAVFLPHIWHRFTNPTSFFERLKDEAGLGVGYWSDTIEVYQFSVYGFSG